MNKLKYLLSAFVLLCFASCKDNPWEDVADGGWNHERSIIDVKFEGQDHGDRFRNGRHRTATGVGHGRGHVEGPGRNADALL